MSKEGKVTREVSEGNEECSVHLSCSIDETNKLRKKLGLAPLRLDKPPTKHVKEILVTTEEEEKEKKETEDVGSRVRKKLLKEGAQTQLGDVEDLNLLNWISRSRALDSQKKHKKGLSLNLTEEEEEDPNENATLKDEDGNYMDLRIVHETSSFQHLKPGSDIVLTLEDSKIINSKGQLEDGNGFLQNEDILKEERKKNNGKNRLYNPVDPNTTEQPDLVSPMKSSNGILSLYDEWGETDGGLCVSSKANATKKYPKLSEISETKQCVNEDRPSVSLETKTSIQRDFMNEQEVARYNLQRQEANAKSILTQRNKCLAKMMKRKRKKNVMQTKEDAQEETETTFLSPLLHNTKNLPIVLGSDDVDLENTFLYAQISRQLPKLSQTISETKQTMCSKGLSTSQSCRTRDPAHSVFKNVEHCKKKQKDLNHIEQEGNVSRQPEESKGKVEFSDITEFCRTLETPFEKMASFRKESSSCHPSSLSHEDALSPELSINEFDPKGHSSDLSHMNVKNEISEKDKAIVQNVLVDEVLDGGLVSALNFLKSRGDLEQDTHRKRKKSENVLLHMSTNPNDIKLEYKDEYGRVMTPKEAFRYISWVFHGKGPGKKKREKFLKKMELEKKLKGVLSNPSQLLTMRALRKQQKTGQAHIVLSRKT